MRIVQTIFLLIVVATLGGRKNETLSKCANSACNKQYGISHSCKYGCLSLSSQRCVYPQLYLKLLHCTIPTRTPIFLLLHTEYFYSFVFTHIRSKNILRYIYVCFFFFFFYFARTSEGGNTLLRLSAKRVHSLFVCAGSDIYIPVHSNGMNANSF